MKRDTTWYEGMKMWDGWYGDWKCCHSGFTESVHFFVRWYCFDPDGCGGEGLIKKRRDGWYFLYAKSAVSHEVKKEIAGPFETAKEAIDFAEDNLSLIGGKNKRRE